jgi:hypothetical protein
MANGGGRRRKANMLSLDLHRFRHYPPRIKGPRTEDESQIGCLAVDAGPSALDRLCHSSFVILSSLGISSFVIDLVASAGNPEYSLVANQQP